MRDRSHSRPQIEHHLSFFYQVFVDQEDEDFGLAIDQDPSETEFLVPERLLSPGPVKLEIITREATHNQTATETCFVVAE